MTDESAADEDRAAFFTVHQDLPREGPGDRESLDWALGLAGVAPEGVILDAGCGPGADVPGLLAHVRAVGWWRWTNTRPSPTVWRERIRKTPG